MKILVYSVAFAIVIATVWVVWVTPPCGGDYEFSIGAEKYFLFKCSKNTEKASPVKSTAPNIDPKRIEYVSGSNRVILDGRALEITTESYSGVEDRTAEEIKAARFFCKEMGHRKMFGYEIEHFIGKPVPSWRFDSTGEKEEYFGESSFTKIVCTN